MKRGNVIYAKAAYAAALLLCLIICLALPGCGNSGSGNGESGESSGGGGDTQATFIHLEPDEAAAMIESGDCILVDTRGEPSYDYEHIPGAVCVPVDSEDSYIEEKLPDKGAKILLYCDYGGLSKQMGDHMALDLGYTDLYEFDGLLVWEGELEGDAH